LVTKTIHSYYTYRLINTIPDKSIIRFRIFRAIQNAGLSIIKLYRIFLKIYVNKDIPLFIKVDKIGNVFTLLDKCATIHDFDNTN
jgi:hypothetical protein